MPFNPMMQFNTAPPPAAGANAAKILQLWLAMKGGAGPTDANGVPVANDTAALNEYNGTGAPGMAGAPQGHSY